jgi:hypothetical protein
MLHNKGLMVNKELILLLYRFQIIYFGIFLLLNLGDPVPDNEGFQIAGDPTWIYINCMWFPYKWYPPPFAIPRYDYGSLLIPSMVKFNK